METFTENSRLYRLRRTHPADVYKKIGGFAEWMFIYTHEFDFSLRALNAGYETLFFEQATVVRRVSKINRTNKRLRIFGTRNELAIVYKHFRNQKSKYLSRVIVNNLKFMKREGITSGFYIFKGVAEFYRIKRQLALNLVSQEAQDFYADNFWSTKPV